MKLYSEIATVILNILFYILFPGVERKKKSIGGD